ncbi:MAG TPA: purine-nucleoside phosphorylase, partial [Candidatus Ozemobacteraceae bacterium]|nr:purine-nucleoside phosphorylase [Candidatus Ozemobacteraceae bacterium]
MKTKLEQALAMLRGRIATPPAVAVVLGSGLGKFAEKVEDPVVVEYRDIPHFPVSTVKGHSGRLVCGRVGGKQVAVMQGRFHYYEGYSMAEVTFPIRVLRGLGCADLIITNASGGLNRTFSVGDLMVMTDHINHMGDNPLRGKNDDSVGPRFPPMQGVYTP